MSLAARKQAWTEHRHARRIRSLEDRLADVEHELWKWGFARTPSEIRRMKEEIERLEAALEAARAKTDAWEDEGSA